MLTSVTFEVNSTVGDTKCVNVSITHDGIFEVTESFTVSASMANAAGSRFAQPVGNVEVIIQDDDINSK